MTKRILLLGANGRTGRLVLSGALDAGHAVTAVVRAAERLDDVAHERLDIVVGNACDPDFLATIAPGHDAIISTLGPRRPTRAAAAVYRESGDAIATAAWTAGVDRVLVTSSGLLFPTSAWTTRLLRTLVRPIVDGAREMEEQVTMCKVDWTIARTSFLNDGDDAKLNVGVDALPEPARAVSRTAVAGFLLDELDRGRYRKRTVGLCG